MGRAKRQPAQKLEYTANRTGSPLADQSIRHRAAGSICILILKDRAYHNETDRHEQDDHQANETWKPKRSGHDAAEQSEEREKEIRVLVQNLHCDFPGRRVTWLNIECCG